MNFLKFASRVEVHWFSRETVIHHVLPTDTIAGISVKYNVKVEDLKRDNKLAGANSFGGKKQLTINYSVPQSFPQKKRSSNLQKASIVLPPNDNESDNNHLSRSLQTLLDILCVFFRCFNENKENDIRSRFSEYFTHEESTTKYVPLLTNTNTEPFVQFLKEEIGENNKVVRLVKACTEHAIDPIINGLKAAVPLGFDIVLEKCRIVVVAKQNNKIMITHHRTERARESGDDNWFEFAWELQMVFDRELRELQDADLRITNKAFHPQTSKELRKTLLQSLNALHGTMIVNRDSSEASLLTKWL